MSAKTIDALKRELEEERAANPDRFCQCVERDGRYDNAACKRHPIGHFYRPGCCDGYEHAHVHMTQDEYEREFPKVYDSVSAIGGRRYRVAARRYPDGVEATIVRLFDEEPDDGVGVGFDLPGEAIRAVALRLLECADEAGL